MGNFYSWPQPYGGPYRYVCLLLRNILCWCAISQLSTSALREISLVNNCDERRVFFWLRHHFFLYSFENRNKWNWWIRVTLLLLGGYAFFPIPLRDASAALHTGWTVRQHYTHFQHPLNTPNTTVVLWSLLHSGCCRDRNSNLSLNCSWIEFDNSNRSQQHKHNKWLT